MGIRRIAMASLLVVMAFPGSVGAVGSASASSPTTSVAAATPAPGDPLPACRYADVPTRYVRYPEWRRTMLDTERRLPSTYVPPHLVSVSQTGLPGGGQIRALVVDDLRALADAAHAAGISMAVRSAYRSFAKQRQVFRYWVKVYGRERALRESARAGHSEHQLGTTLDFTTPGDPTAPWDYPDWAKTPTGAWMAAHAWEYGFVMSYPKGKRSTSCYSYEPWHFRYVGRSLAATIHDTGEVLRRYLWEHFETAPI